MLEQKASLVQSVKMSSCIYSMQVVRIGVDVSRHVNATT